VSSSYASAALSLFFLLLSQRTVPHVCCKQSKFGIAPGDEVAIRAVAQSYLQGLYWVLTYYHRGCCSWTWYYPHLYAPLASDLVNLAGYEVKFEVGRPFTPLMQLLSVLPPQSGKGLSFHLTRCCLPSLQPVL
jgi:5'-3' exonuclease